MRYCFKCDKMLEIPDDLSCQTEHGEMVLGDISLSSTIPEQSPVFYYHIISHSLHRIISYNREDHTIDLEGLCGRFAVPSGWPVFIPADMHKKKFMRQAVEVEEGALVN